MSIRLVNSNAKYINFVDYQYGTDLFGNLYLDKFKGKMKERKAKIAKTWILNDLSSLVRLLDLEIYKREIENYENVSTSF